jgi:multimeric flavodoxin WrbA
LVLATPVYFGAVSAQVKALIDRSECFWVFSYCLEAPMPPSPAGHRRRGVLVATAGQDREIMFVGTKVTFDFLMRSLQGEVFAELLYGGLDAQGAIGDNAAAMQRAFETGSRLASCRRQVSWRAFGHES